MCRSDAKNYAERKAVSAMDNPMSGSEYEYAKVCKSKTEITVSDGYSAGTDR